MVGKYSEYGIGRCIVSANCSGLSNRLKCLIASMRISERCSRQLLLYWPKTRTANCNFSDLFENEIQEIDTLELKELSLSADIFKTNPKPKIDLNKFQSDIIINPSWRFLLFPEEKCPRKPGWFFPDILSDGRGIDLKYGLITTAIRKNICGYINKLIPKKNILEEAAKISEKFNENTISIQVRTWKEPGGSYDSREVFFDTKSLFRMMDRENKSNFFVTSDSEKVMDELVNRYKNRILFNPQDKFEYSRVSVGGMQSSLINLLLLSKNSKILTSRFSTYSELAWWFGGCTGDIKQIPIPHTRWIAFALKNVKTPGVKKGNPIK